MKKILLKRRKECGIYLATARRHRWRLKMTMKNDKSNVAFNRHCGLHQLETYGGGMAAARIRKLFGTQNADAQIARFVLSICLTWHLSWLIFNWVKYTVMVSWMQKMCIHGCNGSKETERLVKLWHYWSFIGQNRSLKKLSQWQWNNCREDVLIFRGDYVEKWLKFKFHSVSSFWEKTK